MKNNSMKKLISYFTFNKNGIITDVNLKGSELLNLSKNEIINSPFFNFLDKEFRNKFCEHISNIMKNKKSKEIELVIKKSKGEKINVLFKSNYLEEKNEIQSIVIDINERIETREKLAERNKYIKSIINSIPDMIMKISKNGEILDIISYKSGYLYKDVDKALNKNIKTIFDDKIAKKFMKKIKISVIKAKMEKLEYELNVKGEKYWFEARINQLNNEEVIVLIREITNSKEKEKIIKDYTAELEIKQMELESLYFKLNQEINKANKIHQKTLIYQDPNLENYSLDSYYHPAENLGGDFYDIIKKDNKLVMYVSDVTGHGLEAAMMSSFIKSTINGYVQAVSSSRVRPDNITKFLAKQFFEQNYPDDYFICIILLVLDYENDELTYIDMGIQDPILLSRQETNDDYSLHKLLNKGLPISPAFSFEMLDFNPNKIKLKKGDTLIFNTDGITEEKRGGNFFK
ncbi:MAG: SpoIIE family protein phosphatase, partial [Candidatus Woesearchaeota archaeon]